MDFAEAASSCRFSRFGDDKDILTTKEMAQTLRISDDYLRQLEKTGKPALTASGLCGQHRTLRRRIVGRGKRKAKKFRNQ